MNPFCPNLADPDVAQEFGLLVDQVGEDTAYWYYSRFNGDFSAIHSTLTSRGVRAQSTPDRPDISLSGLPEGDTGKSMTDPNVFKVNLGEEGIGETNNSDIWKIENYFGLASIRTIGDKRWKFYNPLSDTEKKEIQDWILQNHLDVKLGEPISWDGNTRGIRVVGWPKNVDEEIAKHKTALEAGLANDMTQLQSEANEDLLPVSNEVDPADNYDVVKEMEDIKFITDKLGWEIHTGTKVLDILSDSNNVVYDIRAQAVVDMLKKVIGKYPELRVHIIKAEDSVAGNENAYAYYDPNFDSINLIDEKIHNEKFSNYDSFIMSILHEYIHAVTIKALREPSTKEEKAFAKEMTNLWSIAKKNTTNPELYGYKNVEEFVAEVMTDYELVDDLKSLKFNWWQRFIVAISKFIGIPKDIGETAYQHILEFIPTQETFNSTGDAALITHEEEIFKNAKYRLRGTIDLDKREEAVKILRGIGKEFKKEKGRGMVHTRSNWAIFPVTGIMPKFNIGLDKDEIKELIKKDKKLEDMLDRASSIGNVVHGTIENILTEKKSDISNKLNFTSSPTLRNDLANIVDKFKGQNVTVLSELYVADLEKGLGGFIDMMIIDEKNRIHIYDFKTKESGFDKWSTRYDNKFDGSLDYSSRQAAHAQLTLYKRIFEEITGLSVHDMTAVLIQPEMKDNKIIGAKLSDSFNNGMDKWNVNSKVGNRIYNLLKNFGAREAKFDEFLSTIPGLEDSSRSYYIESKLETLKYQALEFSRSEKALGQLINGLNEQLKYAKRTNARVRIKKIEEKIAEARNQEDPIESLKSIIQYALEDTWALDDQYINAKKNGKKITVGQLFGWKRSVEAWDGLGDYATYLADQIRLEDLNLKAEHKQIVDKIDLITKRSNHIKERYMTEGTERLIDYLAPFYNKIRAEVRENMIKIYRRDKSQNKVEGLNEKEYVKKRLAEQEDDINERTKLLLRQEMQKASTDINTIGMWMDNLLDSKDPVTAAMVKSFAKTEDISHREALDTRDDILKVLREFEKLNTDRNGLVSYAKLYNFMLEKDKEGKYTGNFVGRFMSSLFAVYDETGKKLTGGYMKVIEDTRQLEPEERDKIRAAWKFERTTFDKEGFQSGKWEFIGELFKNQDFEITQQHIDILRQNEIDNKNSYYDENLDGESLQDLANNGAIPQDLADEIDDWIYKNAWNFREIRPQYKAEYENPQWDILQAKSGAEKDLYDMMIKLTDEADKMLPYSSRLGGRLPGVEKRSSEMLKDDMGIVATIKTSWNQAWNIRVDDTEHDNFGQNGEAKAFLPIHYTGKVDIDKQSYDIPTIVYKYWQSANDFNNKKEILPEMELAKFIIKNRSIDPINAKRYGLKRFRDKKGILDNNNNLATQVEEWFEMAVYGRPKKKQGKVLGIDTVKLTDNLMKYTSLNLLGLNVVQGAANSLLGEALQTAERIAGEYMSKSAYRKGTSFYVNNLKGIMGDVGHRGKKNVVTALMETFDILDEWEGSNFSRRQKYRHAMNSNTLFFTTHAGEHEMQGRFLLSMLSDKRAYDKDGNDIGSMLEKYSINKDTGRLTIDKEVDLEKSEWTENDQFNFQYKVRGILSRLHGEYSDIGRVAIQRGALGRMAFMFRKFVVPGFKRRWGAESYIERLDDFVEGNYISTGRFVGKLMSDLIHFKWTVGSEWNKMSDHQKANVRRTITEVSFLVMTIILANLAITALKNIDDDSEGKERFWSFMAYQALRLRAELLFFIKPDETWSILRSPMATMSVIENIFKLTGQMFDPLDRYERGPWKGQLKIAKTMTNMAPGYRQFYRVRDLKDQLSWFSSKVN